MSSFLLRMIALISMMIDHAGLALFPDVGLFRCIGRLAFPIYCFLLVQGYLHTHDLSAYGRRLLLLAILSEIPFDLLIFGRFASPIEQNVLFSLLFALMALYCTDALKEKPLHAGAAILALCMCAMAANVSFGWLSIALCLGMRCAGNSKSRLMLNTCGALALYTLSLRFSGVTQSWVLVSLCAMAAIIPLLLYNGKQGFRHPLLTFLFYLAYPLHLIALLGIRALRIVPPYFFQ
ncbi:MAG: hypothetical protein IJ381_04455 [Clostridia bacterium]|nr:hypothetical protein [Clostridia bacterium]